jgi:antibiotic biosynthesis monooxygenase (ABM) superfamily enzyme
VATMFARHRVDNYDSWKRVYDEMAPVQKKLGVTAASVHRDAQDSKTLTIVHRFKDVKSAMAFANSEELKSAMARAGVSGKPEIWFTEDIEATTP